MKNSTKHVSEQPAFLTRIEMQKKRTKIKKKQESTGDTRTKHQETVT
jgi:hypothetical protein